MLNARVTGQSLCLSFTRLYGPRLCIHNNSYSPSVLFYSPDLLPPLLEDAQWQVSLSTFLCADEKCMWFKICHKTHKMDSLYTVWDFQWLSLRNYTHSICMWFWQMGLCFIEQKHMGNAFIYSVRKKMFRTCFCLLK